jgi:hypothetical protein
MKTKGIFFILCIMFAYTATTSAQRVVAYGNCGVNGDNLIWQLTDNGTLTVSGNGEMMNWGISSVPAWSYHKQRIINIVIDNSVTTIGNAAFNSCRNLKKLSIGTSVRTIGDGAFSGCTELVSVTIPNSVTVIGGVAFFDCKNLSSLTIPNSVTTIGSQAFDNCYGLIDVYAYWENPPKIHSSVFNNTEIKNIKLNIPKGTMSNYKNADVWKGFVLVDNLTENTISQNTVVQSNNTTEATQIVSEVLPPTTTTESAPIVQEFIPVVDTVKTTVYVQVIDTVKTITYVEEFVPIIDTVKTVTYVQEIVPIIDTVKTVTYVQEIIPIIDTVKTVTYVQEIIPIIDTVKTITYVEEIIPIIDTVKTITYAEEIVPIIDTVKTITYVEEIIPIIDTVKTVTYVEEVIPIIEIPEIEFRVPENVTDIISNGNCGVDENNLIWWLTYDGTLTISGKGEMKDWDLVSHPWFPYIPQIKNVIIQEGVTSIGAWAFFECKDIISLIIPSTITSIGNGAFCHCNKIKEINIPALVNNIGSSVFDHCSSLININVDKSNQWYSSIDGTLYNKLQNNLICSPTGKESALAITSTVTTIGDGCFYYSINLKSLIIPISVTSILSYAFDGCSNLSNMYAYWDTPPQIQPDVFNGLTTKNINLYVPKGRLSAYKNADVWKDFKLIER